MTGTFRSLALAAALVAASAVAAAATAGEAIAGEAIAGQAFARAAPAAQATAADPDLGLTAPVWRATALVLRHDAGARRWRGEGFRRNHVHRRDHVLRGHRRAFAHGRVIDGHAAPYFVAPRFIDPPRPRIRPRVVIVVPVF